MIPGVVASQTSGGFSCDYPLDPSEVTGLGMLSPTMSDGNQTISATVSAGNNTYGAAPTGAVSGTAAMLPLGSGKHGLRLLTTSLPLVASGDGALQVYCNFYTSSVSLCCGLGVLSTAGAYTALSVLNGESLGDTADLGTTLPDYLDVVFDAGAGTFTIYDDAGTVLIGPQTFVTANLAPLLAIDGASVSGAAVGASVTVGLVTFAENMPDFPVGDAHDGCGNAISGP